MKVCDCDVDVEDLLFVAEGKTRNDWEIDFVSDMQGKYEQWGDEMFISDRQLELLEGIADR